MYSLLSFLLPPSSSPRRPVSHSTSVAVEAECTHGRKGRRIASSVFASDSWCTRVPSNLFRLENKEEEEKKSKTDDGRRWEKMEEEASLPLIPPGLLRETMPRHVAVIMDGNSRWASFRRLPVSAGHEAGYRALREIIDLSSSWGIRALTVFAFSTENWLRPKVIFLLPISIFFGLLIVLRFFIFYFCRQRLIS